MNSNTNSYAGKTVGDLTEQEYEDLGERAYDDNTLMTEYIELNADKFEEYLSDLGVDAGDYQGDYYTNFIEANDDDYFKFAFNVYKEEK